MGGVGVELPSGKIVTRLVGDRTAWPFGEQIKSPVVEPGAHSWATEIRATAVWIKGPFLHVPDESASLNFTEIVPPELKLAATPGGFVVPNGDSYPQNCPFCEGVALISKNLELTFVPPVYVESAGNSPPSG